MPPLLPDMHVGLSVGSIRPASLVPDYSKEDDLHSEIRQIKAAAACVVRV